MIWKPNRVVIDSSCPLKRMPPRAPEFRKDNYLDNFDFTTVFSDVFIRDGRVWLVGPPLLNLEQELRAGSFRWNWTDVTSTVNFENFDRMSRVSFPAESVSGELEIQSSIGNWTVQVSDFGHEFFRNSRLLVTQQQDNRLEWIAYWAFFNVQVNGIDSIVIYDNMSSMYPVERVDQVLGTIPGLKQWLVVDWDTPFGVTGGGESGWDSDFGQHVAWEHSRLAFAHSARSVMMIDLDELPVTSQSRGILEQLEESEKKVLFFNRQPIRKFANRNEANDDARVHSDYSLGDCRGAWLSTKYAYVPARLDSSDQLMVHIVKGVKTEIEDPYETYAGHFDAIRIRWRLKDKEVVPNFRREQDINEEVEVNELLNEKFDAVDDEWKVLFAKLTPLIQSQAARARPLWTAIPTAESPT